MDDRVPSTNRQASRSLSPPTTRGRSREHLSPDDNGLSSAPDLYATTSSKNKSAPRTWHRSRSKNRGQKANGDSGSGGDADKLRSKSEFYQGHRKTKSRDYSEPSSSPSSSSSSSSSSASKSSLRIGSKLFSRKRGADQRDDKKSTLNRSQFLSPTSNADSPAPATEPTKKRRTPPPLNAYRSQLHLDISPAKDSSTKDLLADRGTSSKNSLLNPESAASTSSSDLLPPSSSIAGAATSISRNYAQTLPASRSNGGSGKKKKTLADVFLPSDGGGSSSSVSSLEDERSTPANDQRRSLLVEKSERGLFGRRHRRASSADYDPRDAEVVYSLLGTAEGGAAAATEVTVDRADDDHRKSSSVSTSTSSSPNKRRSPSPSSSRTSNEGLNVVEFKDDSRQTFFIEHFGLPPEERLLGHFACALRKKVLLQGRLYVSRRWVCFYSNVFSYKTVLKIPVSEIARVAPKSSLGFLDNSIRIYTTTYIPTNAASHTKSFRTGASTHLFTSFFSRDDALRLMIGVIESHRRGAEAGLDKSIAAVRPASSDTDTDTDRASDDDESEEDSSDTEEDASGDEEQRAMKREQRALLRRQQSLVELEENLVDEQLPDAIEDAQFSTEVANVSMSQIANHVLPVSSREFFELCWSDDAEIAFTQFFNEEGEADVASTDWSAHTKFGTTRNITFVTEIKDVPSFAKSMMSSTSTPVNRLERIRRAKTSFAALDQVNTPDAPWGNCFHMLVRWNVEDESPTSCRVTLDFGIVFVEKVRFFGGKIESRSKQDFVNTYGRYFDWLRSEFDAKSKLIDDKRSGNVPKKTPSKSTSGAKSKKKKLRSKSSMFPPSPKNAATEVKKDRSPTLPNSSSAQRFPKPSPPPTTSSQQSSLLSDVLSSPHLTKISLLCAAMVFFILLVVIAIRLSSVSSEIGSLNAHIGGLEQHIHSLQQEVQALHGHLKLEDVHADVHVDLHYPGGDEIS